MNIIIVLNIINNIFNNKKYKYNFFIKLYLNNYIKIYKLLVYIIRYYFLYNKNINTHIKNKSLINFSNKKIRIQKGLGKARLKNFKSPICRQGSCSFGPIYNDNNLKRNKLEYKLVFIYLLLNKRSNIIIIKFEYLINIFDILLNNNINLIIDNILYFKGILKNYYILNYKNINFNNRNIILKFINYEYIIFLI
ncbi:apicoplast ribosomal protein L4, putative (apicoplast) [Plasmodium relictum]|uniref:Large ribosomal subunit protein uL4m n=1 Tax=Plasmodium relictum TaxID=85471 RepID=A0A1J1HCB2_PLARL|nr:apicoplast ribosomal protein L4, putative [Plasmodium relictum]CRH02943.1 apicoplast ribosomal protein L4, putative [Plasmodium relictum]